MVGGAGPPEPEPPSRAGAPAAVAGRRPREAEGHPASPGEDPAGGARPGAPAAGDTLAEPPGGLGSSSGRFAGFDGLRAPWPPSACWSPTSPCTWGSWSATRGPLPVPARRGRGRLLRAVGVPAVPAVRGPPDGRPAPSGTRPYLRNRFLRIFPAYWLALTVLAVVLDVRDRNDFQSLGDFVTYYGLLQSYSADTRPRRAPAGVDADQRGGLLPAAAAVGGRWGLAGAPAGGAGGPWSPSWGSSAGGGRGARLPLLAAQLRRRRRHARHLRPRLHWLPANFHLFVPGMALAVALEWSRRRDGAPAPPRVAPPPSAAVLARGRRLLLGGVHPAGPGVRGRGHRAGAGRGQGGAVRRRRLPARPAGRPGRCHAAPVAALAGQPTDGGAGDRLVRHLPLARGGDGHLPRRLRRAAVHGLVPRPRWR